jgi:RNA polymerase sigma-70 factor (ECF subfamily)
MERTHPRTALSAAGGRDVASARSGDEEAFGRLYAELSPKVRNTAYRLIGDEHEAEDTAQDAFLAAYLCLPRLADPAAFEAWLMRITRNRAVDRRRGMLKCPPSERAHDDSTDDSPLLPRVLHRSGVAEPSAESVAALRGTLAEMPAAMRGVLRQRYLRGLSCEEIARRDGVTVMAVKTRLFRARRRLRAALACDPAPPPRRCVSNTDFGKKTCVSESRG